MTRNIQEERQVKLIKSWSREFLELRRREQIRLIVFSILLSSLLALEVVEWLI